MRVAAGLIWFALVGGALWQLFDGDGQLRLQIDTRPLALVAPDDPRIAEQQRAADEYRLDAKWLVALPSRAMGSDEFEQRLYAIHGELGTVAEVLSVDSLATAPMLSINEDGIDSRALAERLYDEELSTLLQRAADDPNLGGQLISRDASWIGFGVTLLPEHRERALAVADALRASVHRVVPGAEVRVTGASLLEAASSEAMLGSLKDLMPRLIIVSGLLLLLLVRRLFVALFCAATAFATLSWTGAMLVGAGLDLNLVTALLPPLLLSLAIGYGLYAVGDEQGNGLGVAALTTAAGFLALMLTPVRAVQEFAVASAIGAALVWACCQLLLRASPPAASAPRAPSALRRRTVAWLARLHQRHRRHLLAGGAVVAVIAIAGIPRIEVGTAFAGNLPPASTVRSDYQTLNQALGGLQRLHIELDTGADDGILEPANMHAIDRLSLWLASQPDIAGVDSISGTLVLLTRAYGDPDSGSRLPPTASAAKQYLWLGAGGATRHQVDQSFAKANLTVRTALSNTTEVAALRDRIAARLASLPPEIRTTIYGDTVLLSDTVDAIAGGQGLTLGAALLAIFIGLSIMFTSLRGGLVALVPNVLPILVYFGALGYGGIPLSPATSLVACIVIGLAVDNTIHYFSAFNRYAHETGSERTATRRALAAVLGPATVTTAILCTGFALLALDPLPDQARFGLLAAATLACAWLNDLFLTPALASTIRIVTLWDLLQINLGEAPEKTLPLMNGLTRRQARTLALLLERRDLASGEVLMAEGETGDDFFLVVDGELEAGVDRDDGYKALGTATRGALLGEAGFLGQARTATVTASGDCRLLCMNAETLDRLRKRFPGLAAVVYRNLHRSLAERFAANVQLIR